MSATPSTAADSSPEDLDHDPEPGEEAAAPSPARRFTLIWVALALVVGLALGFGAAVLTQLTTHPGDDSVEAGFVRDMSTHHAQAVEMSMIMHTKAQDEQVAALSADIANTQQAQIGMMSAWLRDWGLDPTGSRPRMAWMPGSAMQMENGLMPGMATPEQLAQLRSATGVAAEHLYLDLMLKHHLGGVHMAQQAQELSGDDDVVWLAGTMVASQQKEIQAIQQIDAALPPG